jgi:hypothetical protein
MNIFAVHVDPEVAARSLCDKHVVKMPLETAQMLCAVSWRFYVPAPYKVTHPKHPCILWAGETAANWLWLLRHGLALCSEYERRYWRVHASQKVLFWCQEHGGRPEEGSQTPFVQALPKELQQEDAVLAYRAYYLRDKARFARWTLPAEPPAWWAPLTSSS